MENKECKGCWYYQPVGLNNNKHACTLDKTNKKGNCSSYEVDSYNEEDLEIDICDNSNEEYYNVQSGGSELIKKDIKALHNKDYESEPDLQYYFED